jgi:hypothetical protein
LRENEVSAYQNEARQQAFDNDWMLRGYTSQLNADGIGTAADRNAAAAQEIPDPSAPARRTLDPLLPPTTDTSNAPPKPPPTTDGSTSEAPASDTPQPLFLAPLLPTTGGPTPTKAVTRLDAWGSTTTMEAITAPTLSPTLLPSPKNAAEPGDNSPDSSLDFPGLTAARQGLGDGNDPEVSDPQMEAVTENSDNRARKDFLMPTVASNDSSEFFKRQSEELAAPNTPLHPVAAANVSLGPPPAAPTPSTRMPPPEGIRSHVDDPFDIIGGHRY